MPHDVSAWCHCCLLTLAGVLAGGESPDDPQALEEEFKQLMIDTTDEAIKHILRRHRRQLVANYVTTAADLYDASKEDLIGCGVSRTAANKLKRAFPSASPGGYHREGVVLICGSGYR